MLNLHNVHENKTEGELQIGFSSLSIAPTWPVVLPYGKQVPTTNFYNKNIYCKVLVLGVKKLTVVLIACDIIGFRKEDADFIKDSIRKECGINRDFIVLAATHNHSYPRLSINPPGDRVREFVKKRIVEGVREALNSTFRARIGFGKVELPTWINVNRARPDGPVDTTLYVVKIEDSSGTLRGVVFSFPSHPNTHTTAWGGDKLGKIGPEWPEYVRKYVETTIERELMFETYPYTEFRDIFTMFLLGAAGDLQPALTTYRRNGKLIDRKRAFIEELGESIVNLVNKIKTKARVSFTFKWGEVSFPLRKEVYTNMLKRYKEMSKELEKIVSEGKVPKHYTDFFKRVLQSGQYYATLQALIIDDACICTAPGEVTASLGLAFQKRSGLRYPILVTVANDYLGYFVSEAVAIENVRYEAQGSFLDHSRGRLLINALLSLINSRARLLSPVDPEKDLGSIEGRLNYERRGIVYVGVKRECAPPAYGNPPAAPFLGRRVRVDQGGYFRFNRLVPGIAYIYVDEVINEGERPKLLMWGEPVKVRAGKTTKIEINLPREFSGKDVKSIEIANVEVNKYDILCEVRIQGKLSINEVVRGYLYRYEDTLKHHKTYLYNPLTEAIELENNKYAFINITPGDYAILFWIDVNKNGRPEYNVDIMSHLKPIMIEDFLSEHI